MHGPRQVYPRLPIGTDGTMVNPNRGKSPAGAARPGRRPRRAALGLSGFAASGAGGVPGRG